MGSGCNKFCGKIQDWYRHSCGCCPCTCCKTTKIEVKAEETIEYKIEKKETPYGYGLIHAGVRMSDNAHTSPVLEIYTWRKLASQMTTNEATMTQRVALGGMHTERGNADRHLGPSREAERLGIEVEKEIIVIPIESIISIKYSTEFRKGETEYKNVHLETPLLPIKFSCGKRCSQWCCTTFCCRYDTTKKIQPKPEEIITTISNQEAERNILITIEYIRYSNIDIPSHTHILSPANQVPFFSKHPYSDALKFYLLDNRDSEQDDFDLKQMQASTFCRLVTQLKSMAGHYPDEAALEHIMSKHNGLAVGQSPKETIRRLTNPERINDSVELAIPEQAIEN